MQIKIGGLTLATTRSAERDAALVEQTACSPAEHAAMLRQQGAAYQAARALHPFLDGESPPALDVLTAAIAADEDAPALRVRIAAMLEAEIDD